MLLLLLFRVFFARLFLPRDGLGASWELGELLAVHSSMEDSRTLFTLGIISGKLCGGSMLLVTTAFVAFWLEALHSVLGATVSGLAALDCSCLGVDSG